MQQLFRVFVSVVVFMCVYKQIVQQVEELVLQHFVFEQELLHEMDVHANGIVQYFDGDDGQAQECLRHNLGVLVQLGAVAACLELL